MNKKLAKQTLAALNTLGLALANHNHKWTKDERSGYEKATRSLLAVIG